MTRTHTPEQSMRATVLWGVVVGGVTVVSPIAFWWLDLATFHAMAITLIAAVYIGFAVADGRPNVIAVESSVAVVFVIVAATAVVATPWLLVFAYTAHGCKDLWQHRKHFVRNTRWWPPFCVAVDWVAAAVLVLLIATGVEFH